ncbi:hypothetical protein NE235_13445 [Actinoallomurus spadix]|uniref:Uncharacterized protein n=1 Tax=Actinoallomurus spadix TaxID=79912 RepID=A0ABN0WD68_9ACTN|nr:hypothetical protein [Actinoallomurus spadix]MCO5987105.1 hypothetical protein [Actinoallomurus spadix]
MTALTSHSAPTTGPARTSALAPTAGPAATARFASTAGPATIAASARAAWWGMPFTADPWRRTAYLALAPVAAVVAIADGGRLQRRLAGALLGHGVRAGRLRGAAVLPLALVSLVVTGYGWSLAALNLGYPVRWLIGMGGSYEHAWGGPAFAGVWAFHAVFGGLTFLFLMPWILRGLTALHVRILGRWNA